MEKVSHSPINFLTTTNTSTNSTEPPTTEQFVNFTKLIKDAQLVILSLLPATTCCHLLAISKNAQGIYLFLLTETGQKLVGDKVDAKQVFNQHPDYRLSFLALCGPGGEQRYAEWAGITGGPRTFHQLRNGTRSLAEVRARQQNPQQRWAELKTALLKSRPDEPVPPIINWLDEQMMIDPTESELRPYLRNCILDASFPLSALTDQRISANDLINFGNILTVTNDLKNLTLKELHKLNARYFLTRINQAERNQLYQRMSAIWADQHIRKALKTGELRHRQLIQLFLTSYIQSICDAFANKVIQFHLKSGELAVEPFIKLLRKDSSWIFWVWSRPLMDESAQHHFFDSSIFKQSMRLLEKRDRVTMESFRLAIDNPCLQKHLKVEDVEQAHLCWQLILDLANQNGTWFANVKMRHLPLNDLTLWTCRNLVTRLSLSLTMQAIQDYMRGENKARTWTMAQLRDLIVEEDAEKAPFIPLLLKHSSKANASDAVECEANELPDAPFCNVLDQCSITPFHYAKFALALTHPEVRQQFEAGTLSLEELNDKLKSDPLSGYRMALFGLSNQRDVDIENNFAQALSLQPIQSLLKSYDLTMEELITMVRENRRIPVQCSDRHMWKCISNFARGITQGYASVKEIMELADEDIARLYQTHTYEQVRKIIEPHHGSDSQ